jgi:hypothetical protein
MSSYAAKLNRLALLVARLQDAELLLDADGAQLLTQTHAARQSLEADDTQAVRRHVEQIVRFTEALVAANALALTDGRAVIQIANAILNPETEAGESPP